MTLKELVDVLRSHRRVFVTASTGKRAGPIGPYY